MGDPNCPAECKKRCKVDTLWPEVCEQACVVCDIPNPAQKPTPGPTDYEYRRSRDRKLIKAYKLRKLEPGSASVP